MITTKNISLIRRLATNATTIDAEEIAHFQKLASSWWDTKTPLHSFNKLRVPFIRDGLVNLDASPHANTPTPLKDYKILDVGCGGGILSEPLSRLGANVTGIDASDVSIKVAKQHADLNRLSINYLCTSIEDHSKNFQEQYDAVVASEILEHATQKDKFLSCCINTLKPSGSIFITTISKSMLAKILAIDVGENILGTIAKGTHQMDKFIEPHKLQRILEDSGCSTKLIHGTFYNGFTDTWHWCSYSNIFYALHAVKKRDIEETKC